MKKPTMPKVLSFVKAYYAKPGNEVGGCLHIVLDDGNIEDSHIEFCRNSARKHNDNDGIVLAELLLQMNYTQRKKLYMADKERSRYDR